jgi:CubicO group peptidase (beta-lactamase class C family)
VKRNPHTFPKLFPGHCALAAAVLALLAACSSPPVTSSEPEFAGGAPGDARQISKSGSEAAGDGPPLTPSSAVAGRPIEEIARYQLAAEYSAARSGHVLLVLQGEAVVLEAGQNGHAPDEPHPLHSASESFWGLLAVAADSDGLLDIDEPVALTIEEFERHPWKREIRIRQLLHFTSGLEPGAHVLRPDRTPNLFERAIALEMVSRPAERFQYGPSHLFVFAEVLRRKLASQGDDPLDYLKERILDRIGLAVAGWDRDDAGNPDVAFGANLSAREWAKLGILLKNRGMWRGETTVAPEAVEAVLQGSTASPEFGLALWRNVSRDEAGEGRSGSVPTATFYPDGLPDMVVAAGVGNQRLYVIPSLDLVVVRFGEIDRRWRDQEFLGRLLDGAPE